jgi:predicted TIM-barrel fold metal-dependent hydrolase
MNRRDFLVSSIAAAGSRWTLASNLPAAAAGQAALLAATAVAEHPATAEPIIDTHTHFYDPTRPQGVPWPPREAKQLYRPVLPAHFKALARPFGVTGTVVIEASPWLEDNQWLLDLARDDSFLVGVVGHLQPGADGFQKHLSRFAKNRLFRGIRIATGDIGKGLGQPRFVADLKRLADHDLELDVNGGADTGAAAARLAAALPDLRIVIDHAGNVPIDGKAVPAAWLVGMRAPARHRHVYCKVSALVEATGHRDGKAAKDMAFYTPVLDALWDAFGEDRLLYGSNWPVSEPSAPYAVVLGIVREYFGAKGKEAAAKFFGRNALGAYKWVKR